MSENGSSRAAHESVVPQSRGPEWAPGTTSVRFEVASDPAVAPFAADHTVISKEPPFSLVDQPLPEPSPRASPLAGRRLGPFLVEEQIGGGGMGAVFRGVDTVLQRMVAIKVLSPSAVSDAEIARRFQVEAQSAARLDHDNIAAVYFAGEDQGYHYIVFEYIQGRNLRDTVTEFGPLPLATAISYTIQIASALAHASRRDVVHRDVKPSNVIITGSGQVKLVDMGLARLAGTSRSSGDLTASGVTLGTFDYISPEQARDPRLADVRSDLYSLGCTLYFMLTGRPPFPEGTVLQKLLQHQGDDPPDPREFRPDLPEELVPIMRRLLAKSPEQRYQSAEQAMEDLWMLAQLMGISLVGILPRPQARAGTRAAYWWGQHGPWISAACVLLLLVICYDVIAGWSDSMLARLSPQGGNLAPRVSSGTEVPLSPRTDRPGGSSATEAGTEFSLPETSRPRTTDRGTSLRDETEPRPPLPGEVPGVGDALSASTSGIPNPRVSPAPGAGTADQGHDGGHAVGRGVARSGSEVVRDEAGTPARPVLGEYSKVSPPEGPGGPNSNSETNRGVQGERDLANSTSAETTGGRHSRLWIVEAPSAEKLADACRRARDGDVIELRFNGAVDISPLALADDITIRGQPGTWPMLRARMGQVESGAYRQAMITVERGVSLVNLHLEMVLNESALATANRWTMFRLEGQRLDLENCSLTIRGDAPSEETGTSRAAFLRAEAGETMMMQTMAPTSVDTTIQVKLDNVIIRGSADVVHVRGPRRIRVTSVNGLVAVEGHLLAAETPVQGNDLSAPLSLDLRHVTVWLGGSVCRLDLGGNREPGTLVDLVCRDSIIGLAREAPLIATPAVDASSWLACPVAWSDDHCYFDRVEVFWRWGNEDDWSPRDEINFRDWRMDLGDFAHFGESSIAWKAPRKADRPMHALVAEDFQLAGTSATNPAVRGAKNGRNAGLILEDLPKPPLDLTGLEWLREFMEPD